MDEYEGEWYAYEDGTTLNKIGPENGYIVRDEELGDPDDEEDADARLTLEQGRADSPGFSLTATLYGWMHHSFQSASEEQAGQDYDTVKAELAALAALLPYEEDKNVAEKAATLAQAVAHFETRWALS